MEFSFEPLKPPAKEMKMFPANSRAWVVEKSAVRADIQLERYQKFVFVGKYPICIVSSVYNVFLSFTKQVSYKLSSIGKSYALLLSPNNLTEAGKFLLQQQDKLHKKTYIYYSQTQLLPGLLKKL